MKQQNRTTIKQTISPGVILLMELTQLSSLELGQYIMDQAMENPAIDIECLYTRPGGVGQIEQSEWLSSFSYEGGGGGDEEDRKDSGSFADTRSRSDIRSYLREQLLQLDIDSRSERIFNYLIGCVDKYGFLDEDSIQVSQQLDVPVQDVESCMAVLRSLQPAGICSRNIQDCISAQLGDGEDTVLARRIVTGYLGELAKGHYYAIAGALSVPVGQVRLAEAKIKTLSPYPSLPSCDDGSNYYISPDINIEYSDDKLAVSLYNPYLPYLKISSYCMELKKTTDDAALKEYLNTNIQNANRLFSNISKCERTLLTCAEAISRFQEDYFSSLSATLQPMSMADIADATELSISTVSRALKGKYIQCNRGLIPAKSLFSTKIDRSSGELSADAVRSALASILETEDKEMPLTDEQLCVVLDRKGINVSRRTVAKYREQLGVPSTYVRRKGGR